MTTKKIKDTLSHHSVNEKLDFIELLTRKMAIMNRSLWSDESYTKDEHRCFDASLAIAKTITKRNRCKLNQSVKK